MGDWYEALEYYFIHLWRDHMDGGRIPAGLYDGLIETLGRERLKADFLVHPIEYEDGRIAFVMIEGDEAMLVRFDPPSTTTVSYLGSLTGGQYAETVRPGTESESAVEGEAVLDGVFNHKRLGDDGPLRITMLPPPPVQRSFQREGTQEARERTNRLRDVFRGWATGSEPHPEPG